MLIGSLEVTVVATAIPTVVSSFGGLSLYAWVFAAYTLTGTTSIPLWGRLADIYGRTRCYVAGILLFLAGSALCGLSPSMTHLIIFRAVQGLGFGALFPVGQTILADLYTLEARARLQGLFSGVWAAGSVVGPLLGGLLTDHLGWRSVFYTVIPFGAAAIFLVATGLPKETRAPGRPHVDYWGAGTLTAAVALFLLVTLTGGIQLPWSSPLLLAMAAGSAGAFGLFVSSERRSADPIMPRELFRNRMFVAAGAVGLFTGMAVFGAIGFLPLFAQGVLGTGATGAGAALTPLLLAWPIASIAGARLILRVGYRAITIAGMAAMVAGFLLYALLGPASPLSDLVLPGLLTGTGMGFSVVTLILAVQNAVERRHLGAATAGNQFFRSIGGAVGVALMGAVMAHSLSASLGDAARTLPPGAAALAEHPDLLLNPVALASVDPASLLLLRGGLDLALHSVFLLGLLFTAGAFASSFFIPAGRAADLAAGRRVRPPSSESTPGSSTGR